VFSAKFKTDEVPYFNAQQPFVKTAAELHAFPAKRTRTPT